MNARITHALVYYDGPQLVLISDDSNYKIVGIAIEKDGYDYPLFCAATLQRNFVSYLLGKVDLHFLFRATPARRLYFADIKHQSDEITLRRATSRELDDDSVFPEHGIFSTVHTHPLGESLSDQDRQKFLIDGTWEARDFSRFHGRMADTYSLLHVAQRLDTATVSGDEVSYLRSSISERPWQGGGSYLSFYGSIKDQLAVMQPLRVAGIEYHSPGYVELAGRKSVLDDIIGAISIMTTDYKNISKIYRAIYKVLKDEGVLGATNESLLPEGAISAYAKRQTDRLATHLQLPNTQQLLTACDGNIAVYAKLVLSYFRRIKGLADFYIQGRVRTG